MNENAAYTSMMTLLMSIKAQQEVTTMFLINRLTTNSDEAEEMVLEINAQISLSVQAMKMRYGL